VGLSKAGFFGRQLEGTAMLVAQRINDFVTDHQNLVCDKCIITALDLTALAHSAQITATLGTTSDFSRDYGICSICKRDKLVIEPRTHKIAAGQSPIPRSGLF
jgi:hypothetical protein